MVLKRNIFLAFICVLSTLMRAQINETITLRKDSGTLLENWELYFIQHPNSTIENTSPIKIKHSANPVSSLDRSKYKGVCWFRKVFVPDSTFKNEHLALKIKLVGAAKIYLNKKEIIELGTVSDSYKSEYLINSNNKNVSVSLEANKPCEILVRYSNHQLEDSWTSAGSNVYGISVEVMRTDNIFEESKADLINTSLSVIFLIFFSTLCFVHFVIFLYNRNEVSNLFYSGFCLFISVFILTALRNVFVEDAVLIQELSLMFIVSIVLIFIILPFMFRSFFSINTPKWYMWVLAVGTLNIIGFTFGFSYSLLILFFVVLFGLFESLRILFIVYKQKKEGVKIIGSGFLMFLILILAMLITALSGGLNLNGGIIAFLVLVFLVLCVISIPVSMTMFLASKISNTNRSLANKLIEVEDLSAKSMAQEKEKQHILENQNITLEKQVAERTSEITEQKKVIEEKNKDIIDSINYAKRIQSAMLPEEAAFKAIFNNSFVLYMPRDIVSGDFYYATEFNGSKLIIAADCTGHGVPGALMSMVGCNIINKLTHENKIIEPKIVLQNLHTQLRQALKQDLKGSVNRDGMDVAAVLINDKQVIFASANRPLIYFDQSDQLMEIKATKTPIGGSHIEAVNIEQHILPRENIKQLYLFSDGFADQFGGPEGKKLMVSKFKSWLSQIINLSVAEQHKFLTDNFTNWKKESEQVDDVMVIGIKLV